MASTYFNYKRYGKEDFPHFLRVEPKAPALGALAEKYGERRYLPQQLVLDWCRENLKPSEYKVMRPHYHIGKWYIDAFTAADIEKPPIFVGFKNQANLLFLKTEMSDLFEFKDAENNEFNGYDRE